MGHLHAHTDWKQSARLVISHIFLSFQKNDSRHSIFAQSEEISAFMKDFAKISPELNGDFGQHENLAKVDFLH